MMNELGPWTIRALVKEAFRIYIKHFWKLILLSAALWLNLNILVVYGLNDSFKKLLLNELASIPFLLPLAFMFLLSPFLGGTIIHAVAGYNAEGRMHVRRGIHACLRRYMSLFATHVILGVTPLFIIGLGFWGGSMFWSKHGDGIWHFVLAAIIVISAFVLALKLLVAWSFSAHGIIIEDRRVVNALKSSEDLSWGHRWQVFVVFVILAYLASVPIFNNVPPRWVQMVVSSLLSPIPVIVQTLLYLSLRVQKDGLTPELLAREITQHERDEGDERIMVSEDGLYPRR